jgi:hypothetical protein
MTTTASTTIITNLKNVSVPTSNSLADSTAAGLDMRGMLALAQSKAYELKACLTLIARSTDAADPNLATVNDILASLT